MYLAIGPGSSFRFLGGKDLELVMAQEADFNGVIRKKKGDPDSIYRIPFNFSSPNVGIIEPWADLG